MLNAVKTRLLKRGVNLPQGEIRLEGFLAELDGSDLGIELTKSIFVRRLK